MWLASTARIFYSELLSGLTSGRLDESRQDELLCLAEGGTDVDDRVAGDLLNERTGFTTVVLGLDDDGRC